MEEKLFLSNNLAILASQLEAIFFAPTMPYNKKIIVIPSLHVKKWLMKTFADKRQVALGINFISQHQLLSLIFKDLSPFPSYMQLFIEIKSHLELSDLQNDILQSYLSSQNKEDKIIGLAHALTELLFKCAFLEEDSTNLDPWQKTLLEKIFFKNKWFYPPNHLNSLLTDTEIHLFNLPSLLPILRKVFEKQTNIFYYHLSLCHHFWTDIASDFEREQKVNFWKKKNVPKEKIEELDNYLRDRNPFLANFANLTKKNLTLLEEKNVETYENYLDIDTSTFLGQIKNDIFNMNNDQKKNVNIDPSFTINCASSKLREIQILLDYIAQSDAPLSSFSVFAPNINEYIPFIHAVFKEANIAYQINDININNDITDGLLAIFSLASSKWEKEDVFAIFNNKQFKEKNGFSNNDILLLEKWIAMANVKWAVDAIQKKAFLEKEHNEDNIELNTWAHGFKRLIYGLSSINDDPLAFGITNLDLADFELIDKFLKTFKALHQTTLTLNQENHSLTSWADIIFSTVNIFLTVKDEEWYRPLKEFISKLNISSSFFENQLLSLKEIIFLLKKHLDKIFTSFQTGGVTFGSFIEGAILEKTYICLIGMNHDFPKENFSSFNIVKEFGKIKEEKQNLFLTSLFMTDNLYISYIGFTEENIKIPPSCLVEKFLSYLDNCYQVNGKKISSFEKLHPSIRCHKSYFTTVNKTFSFHVFNTAKAYLSTDTTPALPPQQTADPQDVSIIELKDLSFFALNPLRFHLKKAYDIYFESKEEINELTLPYIYSYIAKEHTVKNSLENILLAIEKQGAFPEGFWKDIAKKKLKKQLSAIYKNLTKATCVFDIHFHPAYTSFQRKTETLFVAPPIEIALHGKNIKIVGKIENISDQGLLCFNNSCWKNIIKIWPQILLFLHTKSLTKITKPHILFLDDDDIKESSFKNMNTHIQKYLACYLETHTKMPIFINPWIENIILEKEEPNKDVYDRMFSFAYPHYHWTTVAQEGRTIFKEVFAPLNEEFHWYE